MSYRWRPVAGTFADSELAAADLVKEFDSQAAAEEWLALFFDDLLTHGVSEVSLYEEDRLVYGPMPLTP